jgi:hypothetical protein
MMTARLSAVLCRDRQPEILRDLRQPRLALQGHINNILAERRPYGVGKVNIFHEHKLAKSRSQQNRGQSRSIKRFLLRREPAGEILNQNPNAVCIVGAPSFPGLMPSQKRLFKGNFRHTSLR